MKILFVSHSASLTGAPRELLLVVKHLDRSRFEPVVVLGDDGPLRPSFEAVAETHLLPLFPAGMKYFRELGEMSGRLAFLRRIRPDIVYCNTVMSSKWLLYARILDIPALLHVHELDDVFSRLSLGDRWLLRNIPERFVAASSAVRDYLFEFGVAPEKTFVFHESIEASNAVRREPSNLREKLFPGGADIVIGSVGRVSKFKGSDTFVRMASIIRERETAAAVGTGSQWPKVKFLLIGGPTETDRRFFEELSSSIAAGGLSTDLVVTGNLEDVRSHFSLLDIFVLASPNDPFPLANLEAMALGLPIVAFDSGGLPEALGDTGVLVSDRTAAGLADAVIRLLHDHPSRQRLGRAAQERVSSLFDIAKNIGALEAVIDRTARTRHGG